MALDKERIEKSVKKIRKMLKKHPRRPAPDEVHDLRTHTRRFEAALDALGIDSKKNERQVLRKLGRVRKRAGKVRDMDVLTSYASDLRVDKDRDCQVQLLEHLGWERYRYADRLHDIMRRYGRPLRRRLKRTAKRLDKIIPDDNQRGSASRQWNGRDKSAAEAMATAVELTKELASPTTLNKTNLHPYRLKVKELRNVLKMADQPDKQGFVDMLGEVKDAIGEWHDWEEMIAIAGEVLDHEANCGMMRELKATSEKKYQQALALTNKMRREYLHVGSATRRGASGGKLRAMRPVLEAAEAIAS